MSSISNVNAALKKAGAAFQVHRLGEGKGEWLITKFNKRDPITDFLSTLSFLVIPPWALGKKADSVREHIMLESNDTAVVITIVNGKYVVATQQHRPILSRWLIETSRGWNQNDGGAQEILRRKLPNLLGDATRGIEGVATVDEEKGVVTLIPPVPEDTGLRTNKTTYFVVYATCDIPIAEGEDERQTLRNLLTEVGNDMFRIFIYTIDELDQHLVELMANQNPNQNRGFVEAVSISIWTAFHFYRTHQEKIATASK